MNITCVLGAFLPVPPLLGGAVERMWYALGLQFAGQGHRVTMISRRYADLPRENEADGIHHVRVGGFDTPARMGLRLAQDLIYSRRAAARVPHDSDVVITNSFWLPVVLPGKLARRAYVDVARMPKGQLRLYRHAARLRANSTPVAQAIRAELPSAQASCVTLVPNPLPFLPSGLASKSGKGGLLYVGRVAEEKGLAILLKALRLLASPPPLEIVGPWDIAAGGSGDEYLAELKRLAEGLDVSFRGAVWDAAQLNQIYRSAPIFVYPSIAEAGETFGLAPLEAMAWGSVPVVSDLECFKDFIVDGVNGLIFDHRRPEPEAGLASQLQRLLADPELTSTLSRRALEVRQTHSTEAIAAQFLADFAAMQGNAAR